MTEPAIAQPKPCLVSVDKGKRYFWCACGLSKKQPFCDGSHKSTEFAPLVWTADKTEEKLFCACKRTRSQPFCDGTHNSLSDTYAEASAADGANAVLIDYAAQTSGALKAKLDNGCYVVRIPDEKMVANGTLRLYPAITAADGAQQLSQFAATADRGATPIVRFGDSDLALFVISGHGHVIIGTRKFVLTPETGVCIRPQEAFQIINDATEPMRLNISVCPHSGEPEFLQQMPHIFDESIADRTQGVDVDQQESMGDRFYQVLIDHQTHQTPVTQFIGEIPKSRAAHHHHLYEETITVLSGKGFMWTDETKTPVQPGDTIFLPLKQAHSLECTTGGGMRLVGLFYPSMSPAINY